MPTVFITYLNIKTPRFAHSCLNVAREQHPSHRTHSLRRRTPDLQPTTTFTIHHIAVNHSLTLLKMGKRLPETCWADSKINKIVIFASSWSFILFTYLNSLCFSMNLSLQIVHLVFDFYTTSVVTFLNITAQW